MAYREPDALSTGQSRSEFPHGFNRGVDVAGDERGVLVAFRSHSTSTISTVTPSLRSPLSRCVLFALIAAGLVSICPLTGTGNSSSAAPLREPLASTAAAPDTDEDLPVQASATPSPDAPTTHAVAQASDSVTSPAGDQAAVSSDSPADISVGLAVEPDGLLPVEQPELPVGPDVEIAHTTSHPEDAVPAEVTSVDPSLEVSGADTAAKPIRFAFKIDAGVRYDDNIFISRDNKESDFFFTFAPTVAVGIGDVRAEFRRAGLSTFSPSVVDETYEPHSFLFFRYTPTATAFAQHGSENALDHDAALEARWKLAYLTLGARSSFRTLSDPNIDIGGRVDRRILAQEVSALYDYSDRTSLEFNLGAMLHDFSNQLDSFELISQNWFNYEIGARTRIGVGATFGYLDVDEAGVQIYEQALARAEYTLTEKLTFNANGGVEFRQFDGGGDRVDPVFGLGLTFSPVYQSRLSLAASRSIINSAGTAGQDIVVSNVAFSARQRFFRRYHLGFEASYQNSEYIDAHSNFIAADRSDDLVSLQPSAKMDITRSAALEVGYLWRRNTSTSDSFTFTQNQVYVHLNLLF